jgi:hypothetical protein
MLCLIEKTTSDVAKYMAKTYIAMMVLLIAYVLFFQAMLFGLMVRPSC